MMSRDEFGRWLSRSVRDGRESHGLPSPLPGVLFSTVEIGPVTVFDDGHELHISFYSENMTYSITRNPEVVDTLSRMNKGKGHFRRDSKDGK